MHLPHRVKRSRRPIIHLVTHTPSTSQNTNHRAGRSTQSTYHIHQHQQHKTQIHRPQVGFKMMAYPAILDRARGTPIKVRPVRQMVGWLVEMSKMDGWMDVPSVRPSDVVLCRWRWVDGWVLLSCPIGPRACMDALYAWVDPICHHGRTTPSLPGMNQTELHLTHTPGLSPGPARAEWHRVSVGGGAGSAGGGAQW